MIDLLPRSIEHRNPREFGIRCFAEHQNHFAGALLEVGAVGRFTAQQRRMSGGGHGNHH